MNTRSQQHHRARPSAQRRRPKKAGEDQAIGRSRGGLSTKIHATVGALGNPTGLFLIGGQAHDLVGADHLLPQLQADTLIADKAFDAEQRVIEPLEAAGKTAVIPPKKGRKSPRDYDRELRGTGMSLSEIEEKLRGEAAYGHHPSERRAQIKSIMRTLARGARIAA